VVKPSLITWSLIVFGALLKLVLLYAQALVAIRPHSRKTKDLAIGKGEEWRDKTHLRFAYGGAWADLSFAIPLLAIASVGVVRGHAWGYALWAAAGANSVYINYILWFTEREYVYPAWGPLIYYTVYWGFFVYWGAAVMVYAVLRLSGIEI
jgi:hypothetical protein